MNISRSRKQRPLHPIQLGEVNLEFVQEYKYLGILISSDLSWSPHVANVCSKTIELLYREFSQHAGNATLYISFKLVRLHLKYAAAVWDLHLHRDIIASEECPEVCTNLKNTGTLPSCKPLNHGRNYSLESKLL